jgi:hypothetical protein
MDEGAIEARPRLKASQRSMSRMFAMQRRFPMPKPAKVRRFKNCRADKRAKHCSADQARPLQGRRRDLGPTSKEPTVRSPIRPDA